MPKIQVTWMDRTPDGRAIVRVRWTNPANEMVATTAILDGKWEPPSAPEQDVDPKNDALLWNAAVLAAQRVAAEFAALDVLN